MSRRLHQSKRKASIISHLTRKSSRSLLAETGDCTLTKPCVSYKWVTSTRQLQPASHISNQSRESHVSFSNLRSKPNSQSKPTRSLKRHNSDRCSVKMTPHRSSQDWDSERVAYANRCSTTHVRSTCHCLQSQSQSNEASSRVLNADRHCRSQIGRKAVWFKAQLSGLSKWNTIRFSHRMPSRRPRMTIQSRSIISRQSQLIIQAGLACAVRLRSARLKPWINRGISCTCWPSFRRKTVIHWTSIASQGSNQWKVTNLNLSPSSK